jgi:hypothetical protein
VGEYPHIQFIIKYLRILTVKVGRFNPAIDTAIKDEQVVISRDLFVDMASFQDDAKRFVESQN